MLGAGDEPSPRFDRAIRAQVGPGGFSSYVTEALEHQVAMDKLGEIVEDYTRDHGPLTQEEIDAARAALRHDSDGKSGAAA